MPSEARDWQQICKMAAGARARAVSALARLDELVREDGTDAISAALPIRAEVSKWREAFAGVSDRIESALSVLDAKATEQLESLPERLRVELLRRGCSLHGEGGAIVVNGVVHLVLDARSSSIVMNDVPIRDLRPERVADQAFEHLESLRKNAANPHAMLETVHEAYNLELLSTGKQAGVQVETERVLLQVATLRQTRSFKADPVREKFVSYARTQFRADLYWLLESGELQREGKRLRHAAGSSTSGAIFMMVPDLGHPAYVGRIWFEDVELSS